MKVVLFCGGYGMRLREFSDAIPKPLVPIGYRPILWHLMKYYAHFGHRDFILCLGWKSDAIKEYFLKYNECMSNDFVLSEGGRQVDLINSDIGDWRITFADTGAASNIGQRLLRARKFLDGEETFLANYSDGLSDLYLPDLVDFHYQRDSVASFMAVRPWESFHTVSMGDDGEVQAIGSIGATDSWINAGFFVLQQEIFDYIQEGEELVAEPFGRLIAEGRLRGYKHQGFFGCMDTYKQKQQLDDMHARGQTPWAVWQHPTVAPERHETKRLVARVPR
ncbi:MAG: sugar phosphate nucleotidyltransferase [Pirellulales bacterium]